MVGLNDKMETDVNLEVESVGNTTQEKQVTQATQETQATPETQATDNAADQNIDDAVKTKNISSRQEEITRHASQWEPCNVASSVPSLLCESQTQITNGYDGHKRGTYTTSNSNPWPLLSEGPQQVSCSRSFDAENHQEREPRPVNPKHLGDCVKNLPRKRRVIMEKDKNYIIPKGTIGKYQKTFHSVTNPLNKDKYFCSQKSNHKNKLQKTYALMEPVNSQGREESVVAGLNIDNPSVKKNEMFSDQDITTEVSKTTGDESETSDQEMPCKIHSVYSLVDYKGMDIDFDEGNGESCSDNPVTIGDPSECNVKSQKDGDMPCSLFVLLTPPDADCVAEHTDYQIQDKYVENSRKRMLQYQGNVASEGGRQKHTGGPDAPFEENVQTKKKKKGVGMKRNTFTMVAPDSGNVSDPEEDVMMRDNAVSASQALFLTENRCGESALTDNMAALLDEKTVPELNISSGKAASMPRVQEMHKQVKTETKTADLDEVKCIKFSTATCKTEGRKMVDQDKQREIPAPIEEAQMPQVNDTFVQARVSSSSKMLALKPEQSFSRETSVLVNKPPSETCSLFDNPSHIYAEHAYSESAIFPNQCEGQSLITKTFLESNHELNCVVPSPLSSSLTFPSETMKGSGLEEFSLPGDALISHSKRSNMSGLCKYQTKDLTHNPKAECLVVVDGLNLSSSTVTACTTSTYESNSQLMSPKQVMSKFVNVTLPPGNSETVEILVPVAASNQSVQKNLKNQLDLKNQSDAKTQSEVKNRSEVRKETAVKIVSMSESPNVSKGRSLLFRDTCIPQSPVLLSVNSDGTQSSNPNLTTGISQNSQTRPPNASSLPPKSTATTCPALSLDQRHAIQPAAEPCILPRKQQARMRRARRFSPTLHKIALAKLRTQLQKNSLNWHETQGKKTQRVLNPTKHLEIAEYVRRCLEESPTGSVIEVRTPRGGGKPMCRMVLDPNVLKNIPVRPASLPVTSPQKRPVILDDTVASSPKFKIQMSPTTSQATKTVPSESGSKSIRKADDVQVGPFSYDHTEMSRVPTSFVKGIDHETSTICFGTPPLSSNLSSEPAFVGGMHKNASCSSILSTGTRTPTESVLNTAAATISTPKTATPTISTPNKATVLFLPTTGSPTSRPKTAAPTISIPKTAAGVPVLFIPTAGTAIARPRTAEPVVFKPKKPPILFIPTAGTPISRPRTEAPAISTSKTAAPTFYASKSATSAISTPKTASSTISIPKIVPATTLTPMTAACSMSSPKTTAPTIFTPRTAACSISTPKTTAPTIFTPRTEACSMSTPKTTVPTIFTPRTAACSMSTPKTTVPTIFTPRTAACSMSTPKTTAPTIFTPRTAACSMSTPKTTAPTIFTPRTAACSMSTPKTTAPTIFTPSTAAASTLFAPKTTISKIPIQKAAAPSISTTKTAVSETLCTSYTRIGECESVPEAAEANKRNETMTEPVTCDFFIKLEELSSSIEHSENDDDSPMDMASAPPTPGEVDGKPYCPDVPDFSKSKPCSGNASESVGLERPLRAERLHSSFIPDSVNADPLADPLDDFDMESTDPCADFEYADPYIDFESADLFAEPDTDSDSGDPPADLECANVDSGFSSRIVYDDPPILKRVSPLSAGRDVFFQKMDRSNESTSRTSSFCDINSDQTVTSDLPPVSETQDFGKESISSTVKRQPLVISQSTPTLSACRPTPSATGRPTSSFSSPAVRCANSTVSSSNMSLEKEDMAKTVRCNRIQELREIFKLQNKKIDELTRPQKTREPSSCL